MRFAHFGRQGVERSTRVQDQDALGRVSGGVITNVGLIGAIQA